MDIYTSFDYLCNEPYYLSGIGNVKCPTLRDIRKITYQVFCFYLSLLSASQQEYCSLYGDSKTVKLSPYELLLYSNPQLLVGLLSFFLTVIPEFDSATASFIIYSLDNDGSRIKTGHIGSDNFDAFREKLQYIMGIRKTDEEGSRFKNDCAKRLFEKMQEGSRQRQKRQDENYTLDNMILKYCTHNKAGINILNVWDMTYYQFIHMFGEYCNGRQCDFNDLMAANTFSYKKSTDYKPLDYMQRLA